jgi:hypothetical protein
MAVFFITSKIILWVLAAAAVVAVDFVTTDFDDQDLNDYF